MIKRNEPCWCGSGKKWKNCHFPEKAPLSNLEIKKRYKSHYNILLKDDTEITAIDHACKVTSLILREVACSLKAGMRFKEIDDLCIELHKKHNATAASLNYGTPPFPSSLCTSVNNVVCHGIPADQILKEGDIINIDIASIVDGYYGDCSCMVAIGKVSEDKRRLCKVTYDSMMAAIDYCKPGACMSQIGSIITDYCESRGLSVVENYVGHGIGIGFHEAPSVFHNPNDIRIAMVPGMIFTIEPMINLGSKETYVDDDKWTVYTEDGQASAQWEHTILITDTGYKILTDYDKHINMSWLDD
jgi:methionyl aminopeptidase